MGSLEALLSLLIRMLKRKFLLPRLVLSPSRLERLARVDSAYFANIIIIIGVCSRGVCSRGACVCRPACNATAHNRLTSFHEGCTRVASGSTGVLKCARNKQRRSRRAPPKPVINNVTVRTPKASDKQHHRLAQLSLYSSVHVRNAVCCVKFYSSVSNQVLLKVLIFKSSFNEINVILNVATF